jgi:AraC-like DNA-binding protein
VLPIREVSIGAFRIRDMRYAAGCAHRRHTHEKLQISILLRGSMREDVAARANVVCAGDVIVKPAGVSHENAYDGTRIICVDVDPKEIDLPLAGYAVHRLDDAVATGLRVAQRFLGGADVEDHVADLVAALAERRVRDHKAAVRAAAMLEASFPRNLRVSAVAQELRLHPVYLSRVFREQWGCTPREYLQRLRARAAMNRIATTTEPLADVAHDSGFCDQAHMTRVIGRVAGLSPAVLRRLART